MLFSPLHPNSCSNSIALLEKKESIIDAQLFEIFLVLSNSCFSLKFSFNTIVPIRIVVINAINAVNVIIASKELFMLSPGLYNQLVF